MSCQITPDCTNPIEGNTNGCASCNHKARKAARIAFKTVIAYQIPKVSKKMAKALKTYSVKKKEHLEKHPNCQIKLIGCTNRNNTIHHSGKRGKNLNNEETFMTACDFCHHQVEFVLSAQERREQGFLK